jgi:WD repeat-containing protein 22
MPLGICTDLSSAHLQGSQGPQYRNNSTVKHGSIGGRYSEGGEEYYCAGSDDFRAYIWKLPSSEKLLSLRKQVDSGQWSHENSGQLAFLDRETGDRFLPDNLDTPLSRLTGHRSIVNSTLFHPYFFNIVTAGVESTILVHSATPSSPYVQRFNKTPTEVRARASLQPDDAAELRNALLSDSHLTIPGDDNAHAVSESRIIRMFDLILNQEDTRSLFDSRPIDEDYDSDDSSEDNQMRISDDDYTT